MSHQNHADYWYSFVDHATDEELAAELERNKNRPIAKFLRAQLNCRERAAVMAPLYAAHRRAKLAGLRGEEAQRFERELHAH